VDVYRNRIYTDNDIDHWSMDNVVWCLDELFTFGRKYWNAGNDIVVGSRGSNSNLDR